MNGYCNYLETADMEEGGTVLLFDRVKECEISYDGEFSE